MLGQQELLEPPPARRIIVPAGHAAAWGFDPGTVRVSAAYAAIRGGDVARGARTASFERGEGPARLSEIYRETARFAVELAGVWPAPGIVHVEQPSGKFDKPTFVYACGVIMAAVYDGLYSVFGRPVKIETVTSSHWKLVACGRGNIYKPSKEKLGRPPVFEDYGVAVWAQANGYHGSSWDEVDALGIAEAARREVALEQRWT